MRVPFVLPITDIHEVKVAVHLKLRDPACSAADECASFSPMMFRRPTSAGPSPVSQAAGLSRLGGESQYRIGGVTLCECSWQAGPGPWGGAWCRSWWRGAIR